MKNDGVSFHEAHLPRLWLMTNIANELHSSWKLLCFLQTSTTISQLSNETKASFTRNYQHNSGWGEKSKLSMRQKDGMQTMFGGERAKIKTRLYKFTRQQGWRWGAKRHPPEANLALSRWWSFPFDSSREWPAKKVSLPVLEKGESMQTRPNKLALALFVSTDIHIHLVAIQKLFNWRGTSAYVVSEEQVAFV